MSEILDYQKFYLMILDSVPSGWSSTTAEASKYDEINPED